MHCVTLVSSHGIYYLMLNGEEEENTSNPSARRVKIRLQVLWQRDWKWEMSAW